jgi:hypothetical protein
MEQTSCLAPYQELTDLAVRKITYTFKQKRPLGRPRRRWDDNIKKDLQELGLGYGLD